MLCSMFQVTSSVKVERIKQEILKKKKVQATVASIRWQIQYRVDLKG